MKNYIIIAAVFMLMSCGEDFLNLDNPNALTVANYPTSKVDLDLVLIGVYGTQHIQGTYGHNILAKGFHCWDHTQNMAWQGTQTWIQLCQNDSQPSDLFLSQTWRDFYKGVQRANTLLEIMDRYRAGTSSLTITLTEKEVNEYEGQGLYLRAWYYFNLISIWGEKFMGESGGGLAKGVPILKSVPVSITGAQVPRATVKEVWDFIIDDLKKAETLLANATWTGKDRYKATVWGVRGLLGKTYVFTEDWTNAKAYLKNVIDNSGKTLVPFNVYQNMFNGLDANEFNAESLLELPLTAEPIGTNGQITAELSAGTWHGMIQAPSLVNASGAPAAGGWSNVFPHQKNLARFGYTEPHYFGPNVTTPNIANVRAGYVEESLNIRANKLVDPRLWVNMLQPYVDKLGTQFVSHFADGVQAQIPGWSFKKFSNLNGPQTAVRVFGANFYLLRMADVYLLYAEACTKTGENAIALEYINKVKRRAYEYPIDSPSPVDYTSLTASTLASDPVLANNPLRYERYVELFNEGHHWFDVRRWKIGAQEASYYVNVRGGTINWSDTDYAQPIPTLEIENNPAITDNDQNAGY